MIAVWLATAWADPCVDLDGMPEGPATVGVRPGQLGRAHRVCGRTEMAVGGGASLLADSPAFYGHIGATGFIEASWAARDTTEIFGRVEAFRYDQLLGPLPDTQVGLGWVSLGAAQRLVTDDKASWGVNFKLAAPTHYERAFPMGLDVGFAGVWAPKHWLRAHIQLSGALQANVGAGPTRARMGFAPTVGVAVRAGSAFAIGLDAVGSFGLTSAIDHLALAPTVRFGFAQRFGVELQPPPAQLQAAGLAGLQQCCCVAAGAHAHIQHAHDAAWVPAI